MVEREQRLTNGGRGVSSDCERGISRPKKQNDDDLRSWLVGQPYGSMSCSVCVASLSRQAWHFVSFVFFVYFLISSRQWMQMRGILFLFCFLSLLSPIDVDGIVVILILVLALSRCPSFLLVQAGRQAGKQTGGRQQSTAQDPVTIPQVPDAQCCSEECSE